jgi:protein TonB
MVGSALRPAPPLPEFKVYRVSIVSPPPQVAGEPEPVAPEVPKVVQERPVEAPPKPQPKAPPVQKPTAQPKPKEESRPAQGRNPKPEEKVGGDGLNVQLDGELFPYPEYLNNIIRQINRFFRWTGAGGLTAEVYFVIRRDGTVEDIRLLRGSGNLEFDFEAMGAVEAVGTRGLFGPLPEGYTQERLPVSFRFRPAF